MAIMLAHADVATYLSLLLVGITVWALLRLHSARRRTRSYAQRMAIRTGHPSAVGRTGPAAWAARRQAAEADVTDPRLWCDDCATANARVGQGAMMIPLL